MGGGFDQVVAARGYERHGEQRSDPRAEETAVKTDTQCRDDRHAHVGYRSAGEHFGIAWNESPKGEELIGVPNTIR